MALVASSADASAASNSSNGSNNAEANNGDDDSHDFGGASSPSSSGAPYSILTYPMGDHVRSNPNNYMHSGYGKSPEFIVRLPRESTGLVRQPAVLECQIDGHPLPDIMWTKDDDDITDSEDPNYSFELDAVAGLCRLTIEKCRDSDQGLYRCILENCFGAVSSTTSLILSDKLSASDNGSKSRHLDQISVSTSQSPSSPHLLLQPQNSPSMSRELTTISEHLSQEETTIPSLSASFATSDSPTPNVDDRLGESLSTVTSQQLTPNEETLDTLLTANNASLTPIEGSVSSTVTAESWMTEKGQKVDEEPQDNAYLDNAVLTGIRTVISSELPIWRQFCITPVHSQSGEEEPSPLTPVAATALESPAIDDVVTAEVVASQNYSEPPPPSDMLNSTRSRKFIDVEEPANQTAAEPPNEEPQTYSPELVIELEENNLSEEENNVLPDITIRNNNIIAETEAQLQRETELHFLQEMAAEVIGEASQIKEECTVVPAEQIVPVDDNNHLSLSAAQKVSFKNCEEVIINKQEENSPVSLSIVVNVGPTLPIYRTMSSPSSVPARRRGSFIDYFIDSNPKTRRRTIILQSLVALQITFLAFLAVNWQEHLLEPSTAVSSSAQAAATKAATTAALAPDATASLSVLKKAAIAKATAIAAHRHHVPSYFAIMTTPLSFVFVLVISSLFTFIFTSTSQL